MKVNFKYIGDPLLSYTPKHETKGSSGADLRNAVNREIVIPPRSSVKIKTGICVEIPEGYEGQLRPRSGLASRECLVMLPTVGTIDSDYRGEMAVTYFNLKDTYTVIQPNERIAQLVITPYVTCDYTETDNLDKTERGSNGFGSTGK